MLTTRSGSALLLADGLKNDRPPRVDHPTPARRDHQEHISSLTLEESITHADI